MHTMSANAESEV